MWHGANLDKLKEHLIEHFEKLTRYPEPDAATLKRLLARRYEIKEENIVVTNGSITAFLFVSASLARCEIHDRYSFFLWIWGRLPFAWAWDLFLPDIGRFIRVILGGTGFSVGICNPNNPDGKLIHRTELLRLISANPQTTFIIDQAYVLLRRKTC